MLIVCVHTTYNFCLFIFEIILIILIIQLKR